MARASTRPEIVTGALLHLITCYQRNGCPFVATCILRHFECLAAHPDAHRVLREVAAASIPRWKTLAQTPPVSTRAPRGRGFTVLRFFAQAASEGAA